MNDIGRPDPDAVIARLRIECEKRGLPVSLDVLLRHIESNWRATLGAKNDQIQTLRRKLADHS